ncbi:hypothetical protein TSOC_012047 [Tetrabaena socialis]|uniref:Pherophorin domain-containing protein n=1 Tax=Tetrabaena socialis TaxID=47790 RepID=A0A2J7ZP13_9CHLO|nr:hypothetical protein TSOC_012047 [Tetrabaena socialis]|eukprot:PNH02006.1 hypothetical protein TSOC_012047 [Tetrabaena socialis]
MARGGLALWLLAVTAGACGTGYAVSTSPLSTDPDLGATAHLPGRALLGSGGGSGSFPWCKCLSYDCNKCSPYRVVPAGSTPAAAPGATTTCFVVSYVGCDTAAECCRGMLASVNKLSFETTAECGAPGNVLRVLAGS